MYRNSKNLIIGLDFDGTCVAHEFPSVGFDIGAVPVIKQLVDNGHQIILFTMRSNNGENKYLDDAVKWFADNGIPLFGINENPTQHKWTSSPKPYCHVYIDDAALGCPLIHKTIDDKPYADWELISTLLNKKGML